MVNPIKRLHAFVTRGRDSEIILATDSITTLARKLPVNSVHIVTYLDNVFLVCLLYGTIPNRPINLATSPEGHDFGGDENMSSLYVL